MQRIINPVGGSEKPHLELTFYDWEVDVLVCNLIVISDFLCELCSLVVFQDELQCHPNATSTSSIRIH